LIHNKNFRSRCSQMRTPRVCFLGGPG